MQKCVQFSVVGVLRITGLIPHRRHVEQLPRSRNVLARLVLARGSNDGYDETARKHVTGTPQW